MAQARLALVAAALIASTAEAATDPPKVLRVGITSVLVEKYLDINRQLVAYVGEKLGAEAVLVQRRSYKQVSDLLERTEVDVAFVCGLPYVIDHARIGVELLAAPEVYEGPIYYSYVIVPADSPVRSFEELRGKRYAFSDPLSNSGWLVPAYDLARAGTTPEAFFKRTIFTYSHSASVEAVAVKFVDGASVDSYVYDYLASSRPDLAGRTRVVARSPAHPIPPVVVRAGLPADVKRRLQAIFLEMDQDPRGRVILAGMGFKRFVPVSDASFDGIREMRRVVSEGYGGSPAPRQVARP